MVNNNNFDELFEKNKIFEKLEKNEKLDKNELDEIKNFSFELKQPPKGEEFLLKEFLEALDNYYKVKSLEFLNPFEIEELRRLSKLRERLWKEVERMEKGIINGV